jgi:hypothetical protein
MSQSACRKKVLALTHGGSLELDRITHGKASIIRNFSENFKESLDRIRLKYARPKGADARSVEDEYIFHLNAMFANNLVGMLIPPFILIPELVHLPGELTDISSSQKTWICSTQKGCQTRQSLLLWVIHFANEYRIGRSRFNHTGIPNDHILLVLDGHTSRSYPSALVLFRLFHVELLFLPSHAAYITQLLMGILP